MVISNVFKQDHEKHEGVRRINIYLLRVLYFLMFVVVGREAWTVIFTKIDSVSAVEAVAWCVWATFSLFAFWGLFRPLKVLPIILFEIAYKLLWLASVAYPLWTNNQLIGSPAETLTQSFIWVLLPIIATPWGYVIKKYFS